MFEFLAENIDAARKDLGRPTLKDKTETVASDWKALLKKTPNADAVQRLVDVLGVQKLTGRVMGRSLKVSRVLPTTDQLTTFGGCLRSNSRAGRSARSRASS